MKRILYFVAIVLVAGLAGGIYLYAPYGKTSAPVSHWLSRPLDDIESIHVQTAEGSYTLMTADSEYDILVPGMSGDIKVRALESRVLDYKTWLADLDPHRSIGGFDNGAPQDFGLDKPDLKVNLKFGKREIEPLTIRLTFGKTGAVYGWNSENPALVYEFDKTSIERLLQPAENFFDTRVFLFDEETINRVQLVQPFGSSWLVERGQQGFTFSLPGYLKGKDASDSEIKLYVHALALLRAGKLLLRPVVSEQQMAALTIKLWNGRDKTPHVVELFEIEDDPKRYIGHSSRLTVPFLLAAESVNQLIRSAFDVQGRHVFTLDIGEVASFVIHHGDTRYVVERNGSGWRVRGEEKDIPGIDMSLWRFTELQFEALPLNNLAESAVELMRCRLLDEDGRLLKAMTFYADPKLPQGQCWVQNGDGMYYPVSSRLLKDLQGMFPTGKSGKK